MRRLLLLALASAFTTAAFGQSNPIAVTGFNEDGIADGPPISGTNVGQVIGSTSTTLDSIYVYYTVGLNAATPTVGLPTSSFVSLANATTTYQLASPTSNNVLLLRQAGSGATSGTLTLNTPGAYTTLSFLVTGFNGTLPGSYSLNFSSGLPTTGFFTANDNFNGAGAAIQGFGRVDRTNNGIFGNTGTNPRLYEVDVILLPGDATRTLTSITFNNMETSGISFHNIGVFGVSGLATVPEPASMAALGLGALTLLRRRRAK